MFYVLFLLFVLGQVGRVSLFNQTINFYLYEIVLFLYLGWLVIKYQLKPLKDSFKKFKSIYFFSQVLILSFLISIYKFNTWQNTIALLYLGRLLFYFLFFFFLSHHLKQIQNSIPIKSGQNSILLFSILTILTSITQYFLYPNLRNLSYLGWDPHLFRVFGLFFDTSTAAAIFGLLILHFLIKQKHYLLVGAYSLLGLFTYSRAFYLSIMTTVVFYLYKKKLYKWILGLGILFIFALFMLPKPAGEGVNLARVFSVQSRVTDDRRAIELWSNSPILGIGYNRIGAFKVSATPQDHSKASFASSFLIILATTGVLGLAGFVWVLFDLSSISSVSLYYVIFTGIFSLFDNVILHPFILLLLFGLLALELNPSRT